MLKAWHLPVAPFIKEQPERLIITLWLSGEDLPPRVTLRAEEDNEELSRPPAVVHSAGVQSFSAGAAGAVCG